MSKTGRPLSFDRTIALDIAMDVFWRFGYDATSISVLTAEMGITAPSLYAAFGDKKSLYLEALDRYMHRPGLELAPLLERTPTAFDAVKYMLIGAAKQQTRADRPRGCMLMSARVNTPESSLDKCIIALRNSMLELIEKRICRGIEEGDVPNHAHAHDMASFYVMVLQGMSVRARDGAAETELLTLGSYSLQCWPVARTTDQQ